MLKWLYITLGTLALLGSAITILLPLPLGLPLLLIGLPLLMRHSPNARRWILRTTHRYPKLHTQLRKFAPAEERQPDSIDN